MKRSKDELIIRQLFDDEGFYQGYEETGKLVRCKDCRHRYLKDNVWTCPFGLSGGPEFFCAYGAERIENNG